MLILFNNLTGRDKSSAVERLIAASTPTQDFFFMVILSVITATLGLLLNNAAVIIGSMLIAPILYPVMSLSLGIILSDPKLMGRSFFTFIKSVVLGVTASVVTSVLFSNNFNAITPEVMSRSQATLPYVIVAIAAGFAGSFALVKPKLNDTLPGIAISVALIPPIAVVGIGISKLNLALISGSFLLLIVNITGIIFASMVTFSMMNFYVKRTKAKAVVEEEDKKVEQEKRLAENHIRKA